MKRVALILTLCAAALFLAACGANSAPSATSQANANGGAGVKPPTAGKENPPLASGHSTGAPANDKPASAAPAGDSAEEEAIIPKPLQEKVKQAEAKAKSGGPADKVAAAKVFVERGNIFYQAGKPTLYKYALRDFRIAARFDPTNAEATGKRDQIISIYRDSLQREPPTLGNEP